MVDRILPLLEARRAHELSKSGYARGKIVLRVKEVTVMTKGEPSLITMSILWALTSVCSS